VTDLADLLPVDDADLLDYVSDQEASLSTREEFLVRAAAEVVRDYCGWHIAPSITDTYPKLAIGSGGIIMLPSGYVTDVASVTINSPAGDTVLDPTTDYDWFKTGYIEARSPLWRYGYGAVSGPQQAGLATVTMTHGYTECPLAVKAVIFELMETADPVSSANVKEIASPSYRIMWGPNSGEFLNPGQISRLSKYKLNRFG
jgi:hypothetical protein